MLRRTPLAMQSNTPELLLDTAEGLFARRGIEGVSLRQVGALAGQRNTSAALYHFGSKQALVMAVFDRRLAEMDARREALLAQLDAAGRGADPHALVEALVSPFAHTLAKHPDYARFVRELFAHPTWQRRVFDQLERAETIGGRVMLELISRLRASVGLPRAAFRRRFELATSLLMHAWASQAPHPRRRVSRAFVEELASITLAVLSAHPLGGARGRGSGASTRAQSARRGS
jgi:AcrR family transcriptional regulator